MRGACMIKTCDRPPICRVAVYWHILSDEIVSRVAGSGRVPATARVCAGHEHDLALGKRLKLSRSAALREEAR